MALVRPFERPWLVALVLLPLLLAWDASGLDRVLAHAMAGSDAAAGFALRDHALLVQVLHRGGRIAAGLALAAQAIHAVLPVRPGTPGRWQRGLWLLVTLTGWLSVSWIKSTSLNSCPWDLAEFGGVATYVGHWTAWQRGFGDGGPGRCFPSGHAVAGFAFFSLAFLWRRHRPALAARLAAAALAAGTLFGLAQMLRGAHFASHVLWAAWVCWVICAAVAAVAEMRLSARRPAAA